MMRIDFFSLSFEELEQILTKFIFAAFAHFTSPFLLIHFHAAFSPLTAYFIQFSMKIKEITRASTVYEPDAKEKFFCYIDFSLVW